MQKHFECRISIYKITECELKNKSLFVLYNGDVIVSEVSAPTSLR